MSPRLAYFRARTREVFVEVDATVVRILLAAGSLVYAALLVIYPNAFARPAFSWMAAVAGQHWWSLAMLLHGAAVIWRTYDITPRVGWAFAVNLYGCVLWTFMVGCITFAVGEFSPGSALEVVLLIAAWNCLVRTGRNEGKGTP